MTSTTESRAHILIVDDDPSLLRLLALRLTKEGYRVTEAQSGEQALTLLAITRPELVITDMKMGGMDGFALHDALSKSDPTLPTIVLTAHGSIPDAIAATRRGVFGYLTKPYDARTLIEEVEKALAATRGIAPSRPGESRWRDLILTRSPRMEGVMSEAEMVAATDASVFIRGESGTGKELLARAIHMMSGRRDAPFVPVNCGAFPEHLLESELFGHLKGAFTGAIRDHRGLVQEAEGGTLFLDEIGDMPLALQVKLLRVLQEREVRPVGSTRTIAINVRIVSATHRDLQLMMGQGSFREDLYYRLNVVSLELPALAERREDIPLLARYFLTRTAARYRKDVSTFSAEALDLLTASAWPGNVRQLANVVEKLVALSTANMVPANLVQRAIQRPSEEISSYQDAKLSFERDYLIQLLKLANGNVSQAARMAKRNRSEFYTLLHKHQIDPALFKRT